MGAELQNMFRGVYGPILVWSRVQFGVRISVFSEARTGMLAHSAGGSVVAAGGPFSSFRESGTMLVNAAALWHALHRVTSSTDFQRTRRERCVYLQ